MDNIDQRICGDVKGFMDTMSLILFNSATSGTQGLILSTLLSVLSTLVLFFANGGWIVLCICYGYNIVVAVLTRVFAAPVTPRTAAKERREGDLRFLHARVREFSESIAFFEGAFGADPPTHRVTLAAPRGRRVEGEARRRLPVR